MMKNEALEMIEILKDVIGNNQYRWSLCTYSRLHQASARNHLLTRVCLKQCFVSDLDRHVVSLSFTLFCYGSQQWWNFNEKFEGQR